MLDSDLARLYGVTTMRLNEQAARNRDRFPEDFSYQLTQQEFTSLISQIAISKPGRGGRRKLPWVFTEHGVAMLSSVLRSPTAVRVNIEITRTFVRLRRLMATPGELVEQLTRLAETVRLKAWLHLRWLVIHSRGKNISAIIHNIGFMSSGGND